MGRLNCTHAFRNISPPHFNRHEREVQALQVCFKCGEKRGVIVRGKEAVQLMRQALRSNDLPPKRLK